MDEKSWYWEAKREELEVEIATSRKYIELCSWNNRASTWKYRASSWKYRTSSWKYRASSWNYRASSWKYRASSWKYRASIVKQPFNGRIKVLVQKMKVERGRKILSSSIRK